MQGASTSQGMNAKLRVSAAMDGADPPVGADGVGVGVGTNWYAAQLPKPAMMRHIIARGQGRFEGAERLRRREADRRRERAPRLEHGSEAAAAAG